MQLIRGACARHIAGERRYRDRGKSMRDFGDSWLRAEESFSEREHIDRRVAASLFRWPKRERAAVG